MLQTEEIIKAEAKLIVEYIKYVEAQKTNKGITVNADARYKSALAKLEKLV